MPQAVKTVGEVPAVRSFVRTLSRAVSRNDKRTIGAAVACSDIIEDLSGSRPDDAAVGVLVGIAEDLRNEINETLDTERALQGMPVVNANPSVIRAHQKATAQVQRGREQLEVFERQAMRAAETLDEHARRHADEQAARGF